jgi:hypothetical protein
MRSRLARLSTAQQLTLAVGLAAVVGAVAVTLPVLANAGLVLACLALFAALAVLTQWVWQNHRATDWSNTFVPAVPARGVDSRVDRLAGELDRAARGDRTAVLTLHALVGGLALERLRDRRGIDPVAEPQAARDALGPDLAAYLEDPPTTRVPADRLAALVTTLEDL